MRFNHVGRDKLLTVVVRIARYASAHAMSSRPPTSNAASTIVTNNPDPSRSQLPGPSLADSTTRSNAESRSMSTSNESATADRRDQGWKANIYPESPTRADNRQPIICPGMVRQRTRKKSLRQSSGSENDYDASGGSGVGLSRLGILEPDGMGP